MTGKLFGIGVGPGDPELITIKAVRYIRKSDVIFLPAATREECYAYEIASHETAADFGTIIFSGGRIGYQVEMKPEDLRKIIRFEYADVIV